MIWYTLARNSKKIPDIWCYICIMQTVAFISGWLYKTLKLVKCAVVRADNATDDGMYAKLLLSCMYFFLGAAILFSFCAHCMASCYGNIDR